MHILLIHQAFAAVDEPGGTRHHELARYFVEQGHKVTVIASTVSYLTGEQLDPKENRQEGEEQGPDLRVVRAYTYPAWHRSFLHRMISFFSFMFSSFWAGVGVRDVDVVWGTSPPIFQGVTAWLVARIKRAPFVFEVRDLWPAFAVAVGVLKNRILILASERLERFLYRAATLIVVNSPGFIEHIRQKGGKRLALVPNGADPRMLNPEGDGTYLRETYQLKGKFIVLYAGAHGLSNDLGVLLEAANILRNDDDISFVLVGDGKEKANLVRMAKSLSLDNVLFLPAVSKSEMNNVLAAADVCIAILKPIDMYKTVYPNKVFDYMAAGKPVLLAIDGVIKKVVEDNHAGVFVPPGNPDALAHKIRELKQMSEELERMGKNGRRTIEEHFDRRGLADKFLRLLEEVVRK